MKIILPGIPGGTFDEGLQLATSSQASKKSASFNVPSSILTLTSFPYARGERMKHTMMPRRFNMVSSLNSYYWYSIRMFGMPFSIFIRNASGSRSAWICRY